MSVQERTDLLKYNIERHMRDLLGLDFIEIRLLDHLVVTGGSYVSLSERGWI